MSERGSPTRAHAASPEFLPIELSGVEELRPRRTSGVRWLATAALTLGLSAAAACSPDTAGPVAPSPAPGRSPTTQVSQPGQTASTSPGPGATVPGIRMNVVALKDGSFDITEEVMLPRATNILQVQLPASGAELPGMMTKTLPIATNLRIQANGVTIPLASSSVTNTTDVPLTTAATNLRLTYRLSGSTVRRTESKPERASSALRPLTAISEGGLPTTFTITGGELLNAVCPLLTETRCAVGDPPNLSVLQGIPADKALVVLQLDLPQPQ
ncbi:hypothetical protein EV652_12510 [Kribbella steppae]|uniref:Uncharacterized protein n=2 Tax=Kribbella steppae TaxID=2512223 RepID=A0A4R2GTK7_9ACTN|nr:hypothetical protein EV652_12510 [Kribbella steppae]